ncbi:reverse transcriptase [Labeo rohita]|uniref:Reverse transcriptase n=1 Tax=Labeo rohita TaxID=84645 RepID=A0A498NQ44_LABRO|nr:reverse transcriptase [Labeo rohita]
MFPAPSRYRQCKGKGKRSRIYEEVRAAVEEKRMSRAAGMGQQGAWTRWEQAMDRKVTWTELWQSEPHRITFLIRAVYDVLPSPANLCMWGKAETPTCHLCPAHGTLEHILSSCPTALGQGRYTWRHNQVLKSIADTISKEISKGGRGSNTTRSVAFVRAGEQPKAGRKVPTGILASAKDWKLSVDLEKLKYPQHIVRTTLRPDIILVSESTKNIIIMELTVPWEERLGEAHERKMTKYEHLVADCRAQGWKASCMPIEVGYRRFVGRSLHKAFTVLGIAGITRSRAIKNTTDAAEKALRWLWIRRGTPWGQASAT